MATLQLNIDPRGAVRGADAAEDALHRVKGAAGGAERATNRVGGAATAAAGGMRPLGGSSRMVAMQLSQVAQQGAATGSYLQALAIQAPDLALGFGAVGIAIGAAVPIIYGVGKAFLSSKDSAEEASDAIGDFEAVLSSIESSLSVAGTAVDELTEKFGRFSMEVRRGAILDAQAGVALAFDTMAAALEPIGGNIEDAKNSIADMGEALLHLHRTEQQLADGMATTAQVLAAQDAYDQIADEAHAAASEIGLTIAQVRQLDSALNNVRGADGMADVADAAGDALTVINAMFDSSQKMPLPIAQTVSALHDMQSAAASGAVMIEDVEDGLFNAGRAAEATKAAAQGIAPAISGAIPVANNLAAALWGAAQAAYAAASAMSFDMGDSVEGGRGGDPTQQGGSLQDWNNPRNRLIVTGGVQDQRRFAAMRGSSGGSSGGGGGGATRDLREEYEDLRSSLDEVFRATQEYESSVEVLDAALKGGQITQTEYNATLALARQEFEQAKLEASDLADVFDTVSNSIEDALMGMADGTKSASEAFRQMAYEIVKELYRVYVVQQLVGSVGGSDGGSGIMGFVGGLFGGARAMGGPVNAGKSYLVGERGPEIFTPSGQGKIEPSGGGVTVHQNINVTTGIQQTVRAEILALLPQITEASKAAVLEARRKGGAFAGAFQ